MKDGLEVAEGVKTASSATNGDKCDAMRPLDEQRTTSNGLDIDTLPAPATKNGGAQKNGASDKAFTCSICSRQFGYKHVLQNHERTHTGEKPFECPECHKRFTRDHHLKTHMRLHTGEKPYQCPHCDRHFVQVANLRRHLRVHTGERPYACTLCESRFSDSNQLKAHDLIHRGEKPFQCTECRGRFRRRHHLIHHKCPKDESNLGKPRRGRRPKAYDHHRPIPASDHDDEEEELLDQDEELLQISDNEENMVDNSNSSPEPVKTPPPTTVVMHPISSVVHATNGHNGDHVVVNRRKPSRTIRILTPQQRELFLRDKVTMQTQAIDMSLSQPITVIVPNRFLDDGVLDLSSSRSDSEVEIVEPVCSTPSNGCQLHQLHQLSVCPCSIHNHFEHRRPLSQRIANQRNGIKILEPVRMAHSSGSDDSNESHMTAENSRNGHHLHNGHISEEEDSIGAIPLTTKKTHLATTA